jgi:hypothetical protein
MSLTEGSILPEGKAEKLLLTADLDGIRKQTLLTFSNF